MAGPTPKKPPKPIAPIRPHGPQARIMLVDGDEARSSELRRALRFHGFGEAEVAATGNEALDLLGALEQRVDLVVVWAPLPDDAELDLIGILRRLRSPVRLACVIQPAKAKSIRFGRLAGVTVGLLQASPDELAFQLDIILKAGRSVREIVESQTVPRLLTDAWAQAIYGTLPGARFTGPLD
jgi:DNA-binding NarL/FixJ family response regulator